MARTNTKTATATTHEGAPAARITPTQELRRTVMACLLWEDTFYEEGTSVAKRISALAAKVPLGDLIAITLEAKNQMYLRHTPLLLAVETIRRPDARGRIVGNLIEHVVQRADEMGELLSIYWDGKKTPLSAQLKQGLARAFTRFDAYQLAKYNRDNVGVKLKDVMFLTHPKPKDEAQAATWKALVNGTLASPDTWEVALSAGADKKETFTRLLEEGKLGGLALLRNLRNMQDAGVDTKLLKASIAAHPFKKVLPFRFISAADYAPKLEAELEAAMLRALSSFKKLPGKTAIVIDCSGSMGSAVSDKSQITRNDAAIAVAMMARELCDDVVVIAFGSDAKIVPARRGFALRDAVKKANVGHATMTETAKRLADKEGYDRIIIFTDEQSHERITAPKGKGYVVNVAPYQRGIGYGAWTHIDGWSENIFKYIQAAEGVDDGSESERD